MHCDENCSVGGKLSRRGYNKINFLKAPMKRASLFNNQLIGRLMVKSLLIKFNLLILRSDPVLNSNLNISIYKMQSLV
jgi:hypothetical protein